MNPKNSLLLLAVLVEADHHCVDNRLEDYLAAGLPDQSCCSTGSTGKRECLFTSGCNEHGVCCYDPISHTDYKISSLMGQTGHCCAHFKDCASQVCLGGACWEQQQVYEAGGGVTWDKHDMTTGILVLAISLLLLLCCLVIMCCMKNLKKRQNCKEDQPSSS